MEDIFAGQLMSSPVETVSRDAHVDQAAQKMYRNDITSVVVLDDNDHLAGILTATDFVEIAANKNAPNETVTEYMSSDVVTVTADRPIREVADLILEHGFHHVPVVDESADVIGMLSTTDLTAYLSHVQTPSP